MTPLALEYVVFGVDQWIRSDPVDIRTNIHEHRQYTRFPGS